MTPSLLELYVCENWKKIQNSLTENREKQISLSPVLAPEVSRDAQIYQIWYHTYKMRPPDPRPCCQLMTHTLRPLVHWVHIGRLRFPTF